MEQQDTTLSSKLYYRLCCFSLFFLVAAASFNGSFDKWRLVDVDQWGSTHGKATFESEMDGTALRPWVYRQLIPTLANWIDAQVSEQTKQWLYDLKGHTGVPFRDHMIDSPIARDRTYFLRYWIVYVVVFLFAWLSVHAMYLVGKASGFAPHAAVLGAMAMILLIPYFQEVAGYYYDYPELAFLMLAVWMAIRFDWWWILPLAALATWNKESFLLFVPALYPFLRRRSSRRSALIGTGVIAFTCSAVYFCLRLRYRQNAGGTVEFHLMDQTHALPLLLNPLHSAFKKTYGLWALPSENLLTAALIAWTVWRVWRHLPRTMQIHMQIAAIINIPLFVLFCMPFELRDLSLLYVSLLVLINASLTQWLAGRFHPNLRP